jgi:hypothetical protein
VSIYYGFICIVFRYKQKSFDAIGPIYRSLLRLRIHLLLTEILERKIITCPVQTLYFGQNESLMILCTPYQGSTLTFWPTCPFGQVPSWFYLPEFLSAIYACSAELCNLQSLIIYILWCGHSVSASFGYIIKILIFIIAVSYDYSHACFDYNFLCKYV